jgi:hypothetical protein
MRWYTWVVPTSRPRYQVTDTGAVRELLDRAAHACPELAHNRKALLLYAAEVGAGHLLDGRVEEGADLDGELLRHIGDWVAVGRGRLLAAGPDPQTVAALLRESGVRAEQLYRVPADEDAIASGHDAP